MSPERSVTRPTEKTLRAQKRITDHSAPLSAKNLIIPPLRLKEAQKGPTEKVRSSKHKPMMGFEPATYGLRNRCSTPELHRQGFPIIWNLRIYFTPLELLIMESYRGEAPCALMTRRAKRASWHSRPAKQLTADLGIVTQGLQLTKPSRRSRLQLSHTSPPAV